MLASGHQVKLFAIVCCQEKGTIWKINAHLHNFGLLLEVRVEMCIALHGSRMLAKEQSYGAEWVMDGRETLRKYPVLVVKHTWFEFISNFRTTLIATSPIWPVRSFAR